MSLAKTFFDSGVTAAAGRQTSTERGRNRVELDDELFLPAVAPASGSDRAAPNRLAEHSGASDSASRSHPPRRSAAATSPATATAQRKSQNRQKPPSRAGFGTGDTCDNSDYTRQPDPTIDADGRRWPTLLPAPPDLKRKLENKIEELSQELTQRYAQIADLCNARQQQDSELQEARNLIESIDNSIALLQAEIAKHESEASAARQALALSNKENAALRMQLEDLKYESTALLKRSLKVEAAFNDREVATASARETVEFLRRDLAAKATEVSSLRATTKDANRRHREELNQKDLNFRIQIRKFEVMLAERNKQFNALDRTHSKLVERYNVLVNNMDTFERTERFTGEKTRSQNELVELLETLLKAEREAAEIKIKGLAAELQWERSERSAAKSSTESAQKDSVLFSPYFTARRSRVFEHELEASTSQSNAA
jgi:hypothetical protein